jgi:hypothetical protein
MSSERSEAAQNAIDQPRQIAFGQNEIEVIKAIGVLDQTELPIETGRFDGEPLAPTIQRQPDTAGRCGVPQWVMLIRAVTRADIP